MSDCQHIKHHFPTSGYLHRVRFSDLTAPRRGCACNGDCRELMLQNRIANGPGRSAEHWPSLVAPFELMFFTGLRLPNALAVRWDVLDEEKRTGHVQRIVRSAQAMAARAERTRDQAPPPYNCRHTYATMRPMSGLNPRIYRPTAGSQHANAAVDVRPLAQLKLRLERAGKAHDGYRIGISRESSRVSY